MSIRSTGFTLVHLSMSSLTLWILVHPKTLDRKCWSFPSQLCFSISPFGSISVFDVWCTHLWLFCLLSEPASGSWLHSLWALTHPVLKPTFIGSSFLLPHQLLGAVLSCICAITFKTDVCFVEKHSLIFFLLATLISVISSSILLFLKETVIFFYLHFCGLWNHGSLIGELTRIALGN